MPISPKARKFLFAQQKQGTNPTGPGMFKSAAPMAPKAPRTMAPAIASGAPAPGQSIPGALNGTSAMGPTLGLPKQNLSSSMPSQPNTQKFKKLKGFLGGAQ